MSRQTISIIIFDRNIKYIQSETEFLVSNQDYTIDYSDKISDAAKVISTKRYSLIIIGDITDSCADLKFCIESIRNHPEHCSTPVFFFFSSYNNNYASLCFKYKNTDYAIRPLDRNEIIKKLNNLLALHSLSYFEKNNFTQQHYLAQLYEETNFASRKVIHDCNNYMASVPASVFMLRKKLQQSDVSLDSLLPFLDSFDHAIRNITGLLQDFSAFIKSNQPPEEKIDLTSIIKSLKHNLLYTKKCSVQVTFPSKTEHTYAIGNSILTELLLLNILSPEAFLTTADNKKTDFHPLTEASSIKINVTKCSGEENSFLIPTDYYWKIEIVKHACTYTDEEIQEILLPTLSSFFNNTRLWKLSVIQNISKSYGGFFTITKNIENHICFSLYFKIPSS